MICSKSFAIVCKIYFYTTFTAFYGQTQILIKCSHLLEKSVFQIPAILFYFLRCSHVSCNNVFNIYFSTTSLKPHEKMASINLIIDTRNAHSCDVVICVNVNPSSNLQHVIFHQPTSFPIPYFMYTYKYRIPRYNTFKQVGPRARTYVEKQECHRFLFAFT